MDGIALYLAALAAPHAAPPPMPAAARQLLAAVAAGDVARARATLTQDVLISDERSPKPVPSTLGAFLDHVRGCRRTDASTDYDNSDGQLRAAVTVHWTCPSRGTIEAFVWTVGRQVAAITFFAPTAE
jgi:hypothetical protein